MPFINSINSLLCPQTRQRLMLCTREEAESKMQSSLTARSKLPNSADPIGPTAEVLLREDLQCAYPIISGVPILLVPEMLTKAEQRPEFDLTDPKYAEAYSEMRFYNAAAAEKVKDWSNDNGYNRIKPLLNASQHQIDTFPDPRELWIDSVYDCIGEWEAYKYISPIKNKNTLQIGGSGSHAVKFLLAGAAQAWLLTPMIGEAHYANALAQKAGVADRLQCVVGVAEEQPFVSDYFDAIYSGGCVHHMYTSLALPEINRILRTGGRFSAVDPWRTPYYSLGIRVFGKREANPFCRPLTPQRIAPLYETFKKEAFVVHHGALTRYPALALSKVGLKTDLRQMWRITKTDDTFSSFVPGLRKLGSGIALFGEK